MRAISGGSAKPPRMNLTSGTEQVTEIEELYWFAMALTGDADLATMLVQDAEESIPVGRGLLSN